jgi:hypothetical protein
VNTRVLSVVAGLLLAACAQVTVETTTPSGANLAPPSESPTTAALEEAASEICARHAWIGIREPAPFTDGAAGLGVTPDVLDAAVRRRCADSFYQPLSRAEADWCGDGLGFGRNFFLVVTAGVDLGVESFTIVEPGLVARASRGAELTDYEIELLTAELQTMTESSRFERDWATACRATL